METHANPGDDPGQLQRELDWTRDQLRETRYALDSIRAGKADALMIQSSAGEQVFPLKSIDVLVDSIIEHSVGATVFLDSDGVILLASASVGELFQENPVGRHFNEVFPLDLLDPEDLVRDQGPERFSIRKVLEGAVLNGLEAVHTRKDGTSLSLLLAAKPLTPFDGFLKGAVVTFLDLTPRRKAEVQLLVRNQQLRYHFEFTKSITDNTSEALFLTDVEGRIHFMNPAAEKMFGWTAEDMIGKTLHQATHPQHHTRDSRLGSSGLGNLLGAASVEVGEDTFMRADGKPISVRYSKSPVISAGRVTGAVYGVGDISERKKSEEALHLSEEKLRQSQKMEAIGRLAGGIAHDFNNLLTAINGYAALGLAVTSPKETVYGYLEEIGKSGGRAASLTSQLLSYSRKQILTSKVLDLNSVVQEMVSIVRRTLGENIIFQVELHAGPCLVNVDPMHIQQVLVNLAINSRDAMPDGGTLRMKTVPLVILEADHSGLLGDIACEDHEGLQPGNYFQCSIVDDGHGMDEVVKTHLFEPFYTTKAVGKGTGLGLSMAYGIVKQHRGHIQVFSEVGKGTRINLIFPAALPCIEPVPAVPVAVSASRCSETVLLVEDEPVVLGLMEKVLREIGYHVLVAGNGVEGLEVSDRYPGPIHLLITDVVMSQMGGHALGETLKLRRPGMPQIFISGYNEESTLISGIRDERILFLQKPFTPAALTQLVRKTLDRARALAVSEPVV